MPCVYKQFLFVSFIHTTPFPYWNLPAKKEKLFFFQRSIIYLLKESRHIKKQNKAKQTNLS